MKTLLVQKLLMALHCLKSLQYSALNLNLRKYIKDVCVQARKSNCSFLALDESCELCGGTDSALMVNTLWKAALR